MEYTVPKPKKSKDSPYVESSPSVYIPLSQEMLAALEVGKSVTLTVTGKVTGLESRQSESREKRECCLEIQRVEMDSETEDEKEYRKMSEE